MKATYIYLNTYSNGYFYVGSHTWDGPEGVLDPNYHGSSGVAKHNNWLPVKEEILEVVPIHRHYAAEREWILRFCIKFGIADCALVLSPDNSWARKFKNHGKMLNLHCNNAEQATKASLSKETRLKQVALKKETKSGIFSSASHSKVNKTRLTNGTLSTGQLHTSESIRKAVETRKRKGSYQDPNEHISKEDRLRGQKTRYARAVRYQVIKNKIVVFEGTMTELKRVYCPHKLNNRMFPQIGVEVQFRDYSIKRIT